MAITLVSHGSSGGNNGSSGPLAVNIPITCSAGDVIYAFANTSMGAPSLSGESFSSIATLSTVGTLYRCIAASAHTSSNINWSVPVGVGYSAEAEAWTGVNTSSNVVGSVNSQTASGSPVTLNCSVTTAAANSLTIGFTITSIPINPSVGTGYIGTDSTTGSSNAVLSEHANSVTASSGTNVTVPFTWNGFGSFWGVAVSLAPGSGGSSSSGRRRSQVFMIGA